MTGAFCIAFHHSINKLVKLKLPLVRKLSKVWLKFIIATVQSAARIIGETVSEKTRFVGF